MKMLKALINLFKSKEVEAPVVAPEPVVESPKEPIANVKAAPTSKTRQSKPKSPSTKSAPKKKK